MPVLQNSLWGGAQGEGWADRTAGVGTAGTRWLQGHRQRSMRPPPGTWAAPRESLRRWESREKGTSWERGRGVGGSKGRVGLASLF